MSNAFQYLFESAAGARNHLVARWMFLRALGLIYFSAFFALLFQARGLIGTHGILPAAEYLQQVHQLVSAGGAWQYWFSTPEEKRSQHVWWRRSYLGTYAPTVERLPDGRFGMLAEPTLDGPQP